MRIRKKFYSKIILFGEYTVIHSQQALAIPYHGYFCELDNSPAPHPSNDILRSLVEYFASNRSQVDSILDIIQLEKEANEGLIVKSDIPLGYGCGSSGALIACLFYHFKKADVVLNLPELKAILALMESYFHGTSSGVDPLVSLLNQPLWLHGSQEIEMIDALEGGTWGDFYLLDSLQSRESGKLITQFQKKMQLSHVAESINKLTVLVSDTIENLVTGHHQQIFAKQIKEISETQLKFLDPMILKDVKKIWQNGLDKNLFHMKLCGAGGGGFYLLHSYLSMDELVEHVHPFPIMKVN